MEFKKIGVFSIFILFGVLIFKMVLEMSNAILSARRVSYCVEVPKVFWSLCLFANQMSKSKKEISKSNQTFFSGLL